MKIINLLLLILLFNNIQNVFLQETDNNNVKGSFFNFNRDFNYYNYSYTVENRYEKPNTIIFIAHNSDNGIASLHSNPIQFNSTSININPNINSFGFSFNISETKPEIITSKTNDGLIICGSLFKSNSQMDDCFLNKNCTEYNSIISLSNEKQPIYHISIYYYPIDPINPNKIYEPKLIDKNNPNLYESKSKYIVIGMGSVNIEKNGINVFSIRVGNEFKINNLIATDQGQIYKDYQSEIEINPLDLPKFKFSHDKYFNVYYSLIKSIDDKLHLVYFNVETKSLTNIDLSSKFNFSGFDIQSSNIQCFNEKCIFGGIENNEFYKIEINGNLIYKLDQRLPKVTLFVKSENSRYFIYFNYETSFLITYDILLDFDYQSYLFIILQDRLWMSESSLKSVVLNAYAVYKKPIDLDYLNDSNKKSKFWYFSVIFFPILAFIIITSLITLIVLSLKKKKSIDEKNLDKIKKNEIKPEGASFNV